MPRDLADVLHHFIPESGPVGSRDAASERRGASKSRGASENRGVPRRQTLPIVGVPLGERDVVRAAFTWNLAVEVARAVAFLVSDDAGFINGSTISANGAQFVV